MSKLLGISVGELLAGEHIEAEQLQEQTDRIILDSLKYSGRMLENMVCPVLILLGVLFLASPLFLAGQGYIEILSMVLGLVFIVCAIILMRRKKEGKKMKLTERTVYLFSVVLQIAALILEILPFGAVLVFAVGPEERSLRTFSYFSLTPFGYANFTPLLTGLLTIAVLVMGIIALLRYEKARKLRNGVFMCSLLTAALSLVPLLLFGREYMTPVSWAVTAVLILSICLQAAANRKG